MVDGRAISIKSFKTIFPGLSYLPFTPNCLAQTVSHTRRHTLFPTRLAKPSHSSDQAILILALVETWRSMLKYPAGNFVMIPKLKIALQEARKIFILVQNYDGY